MSNQHNALCACGAGFTRRGFLSAMGAMGTLAATGCANMMAPAGPHRIDVHHHISPPAWVNALKAAKLDSPPVNNWTPRQSLDDMDKAGIATSMTSPTLPALGFLGPKDAADVARASNDYARKLTGDHPGRFGMFALLPMPHVDETLKEIAYAFDVLKCDGVAFMTSYDSKFLGDAAFTPVLEELNRRNATAYTHPNEPACCRNLATAVPSVIVEYGTDTTRTIASLIFSGASAKFPNINWIFSHGGGTLTALTERFTTQIIMFPPFQKRGFTSEGVWKEIRRFYYDTAQASNPVAMASLTKMVPTSQIVFGTDYPYRTGADHVKGLTELFGGADLHAIDRGNALRILPRLRA